jgi:hypothetical protein
MIGTLYKDMRFVGVARLSDYVDRRVRQPARTNSPERAVLSVYPQP